MASLWVIRDAEQGNDRPPSRPGKMRSNPLPAGSATMRDMSALGINISCWISAVADREGSSRFASDRITLLAESVRRLILGIHINTFGRC